jgi:rubrerythrin
MELKEAFKTAIKGEIEGRELYRTAAEKTTDKKAKKNFALLADEEQKHLDALLKLAQEYNEGKELTIPSLPAPTSFQDAESPIFTKEFKETIANKDFEMSTLSIGIKLEIESEKFYREMAKMATGPDLKKFFEYLADWEKGHYEYLSKQISFFENYYSTKYSMARF